MVPNNPMSPLTTIMAIHLRQVAPFKRRQWSPMAIVIAIGATHRIAIGDNGASIGAIYCRHWRQMIHSANSLTLLPKKVSRLSLVIQKEIFQALNAKMKISVISSAHFKDGNRFACLPEVNSQEEKGVITTFESCGKSNYKKAKKVKKPFGIGHLAGNCLIVQIMAQYESCVKHEIPYYHLLDIANLTGGDYLLDIPSLVTGGEVEVGEVPDDDLEMFDLVGGGEDNEAITSPPKKRRRRGKGRTGLIGRKPKSRNASTKEELPVDKTMDISNLDIGSVNKKNAWKDSPRGKASIAASHKKYESSKKAYQTRQTYEASPGGMETRRIYEASPGGMEIRRIYEASPGGMETRRIYEASPGGMETRKTYELIPERKESKKRNESSEGCIETRRRYKSSQGRMESRKRYESKEEAQNTRRRYMSTEGRFVRIKYSASKVGHESQVRARTKYELKDENQKRNAYNRRVKRALEHVNARAAGKGRPAAAETEPEKSDPAELDANAADHSGEESTFSSPGAGNSRSNKDAMAIIRSHKVSNNAQA